MVKLTLALIVQDEVNWINQCLEYMKKVADHVQGGAEILVVDGGSTDGTIEKIFEQRDDRFTIKVNQWPGYAAQLNYVNSVANGEWLLPCAADEVISDEIYTKINRMMEVDEGIKAYCMPVLNLIIDPSRALKKIDWHTMLRRNEKWFNWRGLPDELENLYYGNAIVGNHPSHSNFGWQKKVDDMWIVHFANLKSKQEKFEKYNKRRLLKRSRFHGLTEEQLRKQIFEMDFTKDIMAKSAPIKEVAGREVNYYGKV